VQMTRAMQMLFGKGKAELVQQPQTPLQEALHTLLMDLTQQEAVQESGLTQFLPLLLPVLNTMRDEDIRVGREIMRGMVQRLDDADNITQPVAAEA
jgi:hypothetical protein